MGNIDQIRLKAIAEAAGGRTPHPACWQEVRSMALELLGRRAEVKSLDERVSMGCETPPENCECPGCLYAAEINGYELPDDGEASL